MGVFKETIKRPGYMFNRFGLLRHHLIADPAIVREILSQPEIFPKPLYLQKVLQRNLGLGLLADHGPGWEPAQRHLVKMFSPGKIESLYADAILEQSRNLARRWADQGSGIDVDAGLRHLSGAIIGKALYGEVPDDAEIAATREAVDTLLKPSFPTALFGISKMTGLPLNPIGGLSKREASAISSATASMERHITAHRHQAEAARPRDVLDHILDYRDEAGQPFPDHTVRDHLLTFTAAGMDTTATGLTFTFRELARHPEVVQAIAAEAEKVSGGKPLLPSQIGKLRSARNAFMEALRLHPPVFALSREAVRAATIGGIAFRKGDFIGLDIESPNHDPARWDAPATFRPDRFNQEHNLREIFLPFSAGARVCTGRSLTTEGTAVVAELCRALTLSLEKDFETKERVVTMRPNSPILISAARRAAPQV